MSGYTSTDTIEVDYSANTFKAGASFQNRFFTLAGYYEPRLDLNARRGKRVHGVIQDTIRTYDISLPHTLSFAAAVNPTRSIGLDLGLTLYPWSGATITWDDSTSSLGYKNVWRGSVGIEYDIDPTHPVRVGYSQQTWYYNAAYSPQFIPTPITENGIHLGTSLPIPKFGSLDISAEVLLRKSPFLTETAGRLMLTLAYSEAWMKRTRRWGY
jgi:long-subunit fatty acid transport protein